MKPILTCPSALILTLVLFVPAQRSFADDPRSSANCAVYAKIVLPLESFHDASHPIVESWIARKLRKRGKSDLRAVTQWVRLAESGEKVSHLWNATVDGKGWGCPVVGKVERVQGGEFKVELSGWSPIGAEIKRRTLAAEIGSRKIAVVDSGRDDGSSKDSGLAYVAIFIGPSSPDTKSPQ